MSNDKEPPSYPPRIRRIQRSDNSTHPAPFPSSIPVQYAPNVAAIPVGVPNRESAPMSSARTEDDRARRHPARENSVPEIDTLSPPPPPSRSKTDPGRRVGNTAYRESHERSGYRSDHEENPGGRKGKGKETSTGAHARFHPYPHGASRGAQLPSNAERDYKEGRGAPHAGSSRTAGRRSPPVYEETDSEIEPSSPGPGPFRAAPPQAEESDDDHLDGSDVDELDSDSDEDRPIPPSQLSGGARSAQPLPSTWRYAGARPQRRNLSEERFTPPAERHLARPLPHRYQSGERSPREQDPVSPGGSQSARPLPRSWQYGYGESSSSARPRTHDADEQRPLHRPPPSHLEHYLSPRGHIDGPFAPSSRRYDPREELPTRRLMDTRLENVSNPHWTPYSPGKTLFPLSPAKFSTSPPAQPAKPPQPARPIQVTIPERGPDPPEPYAPPEGPPGLKFIIPPHAIISRRSPPPPSLPSDIETEAVLRNVTGLPAPMPLDLSSLRDATNRRELPKLSMLMALAIWGSPTHMLTLSGIISTIEARFPFMQTDDSWKRTVRHKLSFVSAFVRAGKHNEGWVLDVRKSFAGRGAKRLAELRAAARM